jgi:hypothetical protein
MLELHYLTRDQADAMTYPTAVKPYDEAAERAGPQRPVGLVANPVFSELFTNPSSRFKGMSWKTIRGGSGWSI